MRVLTWLAILALATPCWAAAGQDDRQEAEYYVVAYAQHYRVPVEFVRALVEQESAWRKCAISSKGAAGLMQLMPETARRLGVQDRCDLRQNISGGVRHLAYLMAKFHGDLRLVAAAYYVGERVIEAKGPRYSNPDVVAYVARLRARFERQKQFQNAKLASNLGRTR
ncbi:MAG TPA: lytic transglycosylase domain-containing protein [Candidatus Angelobacter sp.]|nr:lytic transglycosylase domain-containing protein [Candidatus Angelobacter sp.]